MVCDWLKSLWIQRKYFQRPPGHSTLFCVVALFVSEIWACTYTLPQIDGFTFLKQAGAFPNQKPSPGVHLT